MADLSDEPIDLSLALSLGRRPTLPPPSSPPHSAGHQEPIPILSGSPDVPQHSRVVLRNEQQFLCCPSAADRAALQAAERQARLRDREARENETPLPVAALSMQVQYVPVMNGYGVPPSMMPCWAAAIPGDGSKKKMKNKGEKINVTSRYFPLSRGIKSVTGMRTRDSNFSSSNSGISAHQSGSLRGGGVRSRSSSSSSSSDAGTNSSLNVEKPQHQISSMASNPQVKYASTQATEASTEKLISSTAQSTLVPTSDNTPAAAPRKLEGANSVNKPLSIVDEKQSKSRGPALPRMPCVAATGDGPNGKTITGVLYRYTKSEVSILCVCHGTSFTPAEFVKHAGGTETEHPMRQIVVVPS